MPKQLIYIAAGFLFVGVFPLPYGYFTLLRFIACGVFAWAAYISFERNKNVLPWFFVILAVVFNPVIKIHFPKEIWAFVDISSAILLLVTVKEIKSNHNSSSEP